MLAAIIDCETNGREPPECIERAIYWGSFEQLSGAVDITIDEQYHKTLKATSVRRYKPEQSSTPEALAVHNIFGPELEGKLPSSHAGLQFATLINPPGAPTPYVIGHNIDYDLACLGDPPCNRICTLAISRALWPERPHKLWALVYSMLQDAECMQLRSWCTGHTAAGDVLACKILTAAIIKRSEVKSIDELYQLSENSRIPTHMPFGKHKGELISQVPSGYKDWLRKQPDVDKYLLIALGGPL